MQTVTGTTGDCFFDCYRKSVKLLLNAFWRRVRDLNPSYAINVNTISSRAPSTTQPTLHGLQRCVIHNENDYNPFTNFCQHYFDFSANFFLNDKKAPTICQNMIQ